MSAMPGKRRTTADMRSDAMGQTQTSEQIGGLALHPSLVGVILDGPLKASAAWSEGAVLISYIYAKVSDGKPQKARPPPPRSRSGGDR